MVDAVGLPDGAVLRAVRDDEWGMIAWLWQAFREDLSPIVDGLPYADGRFAARPLDAFPSANGMGHVAMRPHPNTGEEAPIAFALVDGVGGEVRRMVAFWVAPPVRRAGFGAAFARAVIALHPGPWEVGFQHDNVAATAFWPRVADAAFGAGRWSETEEPVPGRPHVPADHFVRGATPSYP